MKPVTPPVAMRCARWWRLRSHASTPPTRPPASASRSAPIGTSPFSFGGWGRSVVVAAESWVVPLPVGGRAAAPVEAHAHVGVGVALRPHLHGGGVAAVGEQRARGAGAQVDLHPAPRQRPGRGDALACTLAARLRGGGALAAGRAAPRR